MWCYHQDTGSNRFGDASLQGVESSSVCHKNPCLFNSAPCHFQVESLSFHILVCNQSSGMSSIHAVLFLAYLLMTHVFRDIVPSYPEYVTDFFTLKQCQYEVFQIET